MVKEKNIVGHYVQLPCTSENARFADILRKIVCKNKSQQIGDFMFCCTWKAFQLLYFMDSIF